jgi:hypothetical protein
MIRRPFYLVNGFGKNYSFDLLACRLCPCDNNTLI